MHKGFTLIELLVVIAILTILLAITLVAINPQAQFRKATNSNRASDAKAIANAIQQYSVDSAQLPISTNGLAIPFAPIANHISNTTLDICSALVPVYIAQLPRDPAIGSGGISDCTVPYTTNYYVYQDAQNRPFAVPTTSVPNSITLFSNSTTYAFDRFNRTTTSGLGTAETGGTWTVNVPTEGITNGSEARFNNAGTYRSAELASVSALNVTMFMRFKVEKLGTGVAGSQSVMMMARRQVGSHEYRVKTQLNTTGQMIVLISKATPGEANIGNTFISAYTFAPNTWYRMKGRVSGTSPTTITAKMWLEGDAEPSLWQATATDSDASLQTAGTTGIANSHAAFTNRPILYTSDDYIVTD